MNDLNESAEDIRKREGNHGESMKQWKRTVECPGPDKGRRVNVLSCNVEIYIYVMTTRAMQGGTRRKYGHRWRKGLHVMNEKQYAPLDEMEKRDKVASHRWSMG